MGKMALGRKLGLIGMILGSLGMTAVAAIPLAAGGDCDGLRRWVGEMEAELAVAQARRAGRHDEIEGRSANLDSARQALAECGTRNPYPLIAVALILGAAWSTVVVVHLRRRRHKAFRAVEASPAESGRRLALRTGPHSTKFRTL